MLHISFTWCYKQVIICKWSCCIGVYQDPCRFKSVKSANTKTFIFSLLKDINILDFPTRERHACFYFRNATPRRDVWACLDFGTILSRVLVTALASAVIVRAQRKAPRFNPVFTSSLQLYLNLYAYLFYGYFSGQSPHAMWYTDTKISNVNKLYVIS